MVSWQRPSAPSTVSRLSRKVYSIPTKLTSVVPGAVTLALFFATIPYTAHAGSIGLALTAPANLEGDSLSAALSVKNQGDEAAHSVSAVLHFDGHYTRGAGRSLLAPAETYKNTLQVATGNLGTGRWPYAVTVDYSDANQYPFQAVLVGILTVGNPPPAKVLIALDHEPSISDSGADKDIALHVRNMSGTKLSATVRLLLPENIEIVQPAAPIEIAAWANVHISIPIVNRTALLGSVFPLTATLEYNDAGIHHTAMAEDVLRVAKEKSLFSQARLLMTGTAVLLICGWLGFLALRRWRP